ncbi:MAG TPA: hypothetical protein VI702_06805 [Nitrospiria bacterium]
MTIRTAGQHGAGLIAAMVTACAILAAAILPAAGAAAPDTGKEMTAPEAATPDPFPDLSADLQITLIDRSGHSSTTQTHILRSGRVIRYEARDTDPPEITIRDYNQSKEFRIFDNDKIYFETAIPLRGEVKAQRDGMFSWQDYEQIEIKRIVLRADRIEGHPCEIVLMLRSLKNQKASGIEYTLLWEATDLNRQPLRVAYHQTNTLVITELRNIVPGPVNSALLKPPEGYSGMSPF